jgi:tryptophanase
MNDPNQGTGSPRTIDRRALPSVEIGQSSVVTSAHLETLTQILSAREAEVNRLQGALEQALAKIEEHAGGHAVTLQLLAEHQAIQQIG